MKRTHFRMNTSERWPALKMGSFGISWIRRSEGDDLKEANLDQPPLTNCQPTCGSRATRFLTVAARLFALADSGIRSGIGGNPLIHERIFARFFEYLLCLYQNISDNPLMRARKLAEESDEKSRTDGPSQIPRDTPLRQAPQIGSCFDWNTGTYHGTRGTVCHRSTAAAAGGLTIHPAAKSRSEGAGPCERG
jgi:hypothetical protein